MLAALGQEILVLSHQHPLSVVIGVGNITGEASKVGHELFSSLRMVCLVGWRSTSYESGLCLKDALIPVTGGTEKIFMMAIEGSEGRYDRHSSIRTGAERGDESHTMGVLAYQHW